MTTHKCCSALRTQLSALKVPGSLFLCLSVSSVLAIRTAHSQPPEPIPNNTAIEHMGPIAPPERISTLEDIAREMGQPGTLTLHLHGTPLRDVLDSITAQSAVRFQLNEGMNTPKISIDLDREPFWAGLMMVLRQSGYALVPDYYQSQYVVQEAGPDARAFLSGPRTNNGPFVLELSACHIVNSRQWEQTNARDRPSDREVTDSSPLQVEGRLLCDPRLQMFGGQVAITNAQDDTGKSMILENRGMRGPSGSMAQEVELRIFLKRPAPDAKMLTTLSGSFRVHVVTASARWEIPDPAKVGTMTKTFDIGAGKLAVTLKVMKKEDDEGSLTDVTLTAPENDQADRKLAEFLVGAMRWVDAAGHPVAGNIDESSWGDENNKLVVHNVFRFGDPGQPAPALAEPLTLLIAIPVNIRTVDIPFQFHDLPLP